MPIKLEFNFEHSDLKANIDAFKNKARSAILMYAVTKAPEIEAYMKENRPWTDRTALAKQMLRTTVSNDNPDEIVITLAHGVDYGVWLELAHEQNYAIIQPTLNLKGPEIMNGVSNIMSKMK